MVYLDIVEEEHERVAVRGHRSRAHRSLRQVLGEERLDERLEGRHGYRARDATHRALPTARQSVGTCCPQAPSAPVHSSSTSTCWRSWRGQGRWTATASSGQYRCPVYARAVGCGVCGEVADAAVLCPSFYRAELVYNPSRWDRLIGGIRAAVIGVLQRR